MNKHFKNVDPHPLVQSLHYFDLMFFSQNYNDDSNILKMGFPNIDDFEAFV